MATTGTTINLPTNGEPAQSRPAGRRGRALPPIVHRTPAEHAALGEEARKRVPHQAHAEFAPTSSRRDPIALLTSQASGRVPDLVPIRYGRMLVSPFTFYRGAALVMAHDLAGTPTSGIVTQLCGDAHLSNFGLFASPERRLVFDINDFDETQPGPWEWDVKRLAASLEIACRDNNFSMKQRRGIVRTAVGRYRVGMQRFAMMRNLDVWYLHADVADLEGQLSAEL